MATITNRITLADHGRAMTLEEFREAEVEEGYRYELSRGVLEVTIVPREPHGVVVSNLYELVAVYKRGHQDIVLRFGGGSEFRLWLPVLVSGRNPDLAVVLRNAPRDPQGFRTPSLVAEVVSRSSGDRDYRVKREEYLAYGLREYWIVDLLARKFTLLIRDGDAWVERVLTDDQVIPSLVLPGLAATVAELWVDLDEVEADAEDE